MTIRDINLDAASDAEVFLDHVVRSHEPRGHYQTAVEARHPSKAELLTDRIDERACGLAVAALLKLRHHPGAFKRGCDFDSLMESFIECDKLFRAHEYEPKDMEYKNIMIGLAGSAESNALRTGDMLTITLAMAQHMVSSSVLWNRMFQQQDTSKSWQEKILVVKRVVGNHLYLETMDAYTPFISISHRWKPASTPVDVTIHVEEHGREVASWNHTVENKAVELMQQLTPFAPVWMDNFCIWQKSAAHKSCQVSIMGAIFSFSLTVIVNEDYEAGMPNEQYWERTWTFQEYRYGAVLPFAFAETHDLFDLIKSMGEVNKTELFGPFAINDLSDWRLGALTDKNLYRPWHRELNELRWNAYQHRAGLDKFNKSLTLAALISRQYFGELNEHNYIQNLILMRMKKCEFPKDRLFGIWGVPCQIIGGLRLNYADPLASLEQIRQLCNATHFAFNRVDDPLCRDGFSLPLEEQIKSIPPGADYDGEHISLHTRGLSLTSAPSEAVRRYEVPMVTSPGSRYLRDTYGFKITAFVDRDTKNIHVEVHCPVGEPRKSAHFTFLHGRPPSKDAGNRALAMCAEDYLPWPKGLFDRNNWNKEYHWGWPFNIMEEVYKFLDTVQ